MTLRTVLVFTRAAARKALDVGEGLAIVVWLACDHARRKLTGQRSLADEIFGDLHFELSESDLMPPYDIEPKLVEEARTKQTRETAPVQEARTKQTRDKGASAKQAVQASTKPAAGNVVETNWMLDDK